MKSGKELTPIEFARKLRRQPTSSEVSLWHALRNRRRGFKFRRQHSIGPFVADFYCLEAKVVVESDGKDHFTEVGRAYDESRDQWMERHGIEVLRFTGNQIDQNLERVLAIIDAKLEERMGTRVNDACEKGLRSELIATTHAQLAIEEHVGDSTSQPSPPAPSPVRTGEGFQKPQRFKLPLSPHLFLPSPVLTGEGSGVRVFLCLENQATQNMSVIFKVSPSSSYSPSSSSSPFSRRWSSKPSAAPAKTPSPPKPEQQSPRSIPS